MYHRRGGSAKTCVTKDCRRRGENKGPRRSSWAANPTDGYEITRRESGSKHTFWSAGAVWRMLSMRAGRISVTLNTPAPYVPSWAVLAISWCCCLAKSTHFRTTESIRYRTPSL